MRLPCDDNAARARCRDVARPGAPAQRRPTVSITRSRGASRDGWTESDCVMPECRQYPRGARVGCMQCWAAFGRSCLVYPLDIALTVCSQGAWSIASSLISAILPSTNRMKFIISYFQGLLSTNPVRVNQVATQSPSVTCACIVSVNCD